MKRSFLPAFLSIAVLFSLQTNAQVGIGTITPSPHAVLDLKSPGNNQGFLVPRLTGAQRTSAAFISSLTNSEAGLLVFDTDDAKFYYWSGSAWIVIEDSVGTGTVTTVSTGAGLTGGPISVTGTISLADNGVTTIKINNDAVTSSKVLDGTITSSDISDGTIATIDLANTSVTDAKIGTGITVSKLTASGTAGQVLTTVGTTTTWAALPDASATNEIQDLSLTANTLSLTSDATTVNLAPYLDNTDAQNLTFTSPNLSISGGNSVNLSAINTDAQTLSFTSPNLSITGGNSINISGINTDSQDLTLAANTLSLTGDATTVSLAAYLDNTDAQDLSLAGNTLSLTGDATSVSLAGYLDNTDAQTLSFTSPNLSISGGNSINLSTINTDSQDLSLAGNTLSLTGDASTVSLAAYLDNTDAQDLTLAGNTLSLSGDATSVSLGAYLDNTDAQDLSLAGNTLSLTGDGTTVSLAAYLDNTDAQNLSLGTRTGTLQPVNISGGTSVSIDVADNDNSITNEIQDLSLTGNTLSLTSDATTVSLAAYLDNTDNQDLSLTGNTLSLSNDATTVSLAGYMDNTDAQTLTFTPATSALSISGGNSVTVSATGVAGGDLNGSFPSPTVDGIQGVGVTATTPTTGQVLKYNGTAWAPGTDNGGTPNLNAVLGTGNNAGGQSAINFSALSINRTDTPGALNVNGSHYSSFTALGTVAAYTVAADDYIIIGTATPGVTTIVTLPDASASIGRVLIFRGRSVGSASAAGLRVQTASGDTIDGATLTPYLTPVNSSFISITIVAISANEWTVVSKSPFNIN